MSREPSAAALGALDAQHPELADQVAEDHRAVAGIPTALHSLEGAAARATSPMCRDRVHIAAARAAFVFDWRSGNWLAPARNSLVGHLPKLSL